jgi:hypothetical protein
MTRAMIEQTQQMLEQLPHKVAQPEAGKAAVAPTRMDDYLQHLKDSYAYLPPRLQYWVVDGFYSKKKFVDGVVGLNLQVISAPPQRC